MTKPRSLFIAFSGDESTLVATIARVVGISLERADLETGTVYRGRGLETELVLLTEHGLEDDSGIEFSQYLYQLDLIPLEMGARAASYAEAYESMTTFIAELLALELDARTLVVGNLQHVVVAFP
jgi:hypothetical protein